MLEGLELDTGVASVTVLIPVCCVSWPHSFFILYALDARIIIKEPQLTSLHRFACKFAQSISKFRLKKREPPLFSVEIFGQKKKKEEEKKKGDKPFNFIASRALKYSLRSTFHFQALCRRQESWHLWMLLYAQCYSALRCSLRAIAQLHPIAPPGGTPSFAPVQNGVR